MTGLLSGSVPVRLLRRLGSRVAWCEWWGVQSAVQSAAEMSGGDVILSGGDVRPPPRRQTCLQPQAFNLFALLVDAPYVRSEAQSQNADPLPAISTRAELAVLLLISPCSVRAGQVRPPMSVSFPCSLQPGHGDWHCA